MICKCSAHFYSSHDGYDALSRNLTVNNNIANQNNMSVSTQDPIGCTSRALSGGRQAIDYKYTDEERLKIDKDLGLSPGMHIKDYYLNLPPPDQPEQTSATCNISNMDEYNSEVEQAFKESNDVVAICLKHFNKRLRIVKCSK